MLLSYQLAIDVLVLLAGSPNQISQLPSFDKSGEGPALHRLGHSRTRINYILPLTFSLQSINSCIYLSHVWQSFFFLVLLMTIIQNDNLQNKNDR